MNKNIFGVHTNYQSIGSSAQKLVLLHGWGCNWEIWSPIISRLSETYQLIIPDLPSLGKSEAPKTTWTTSQFAQWLDAFIQETVGDHEFSVMGHSFGGKIATVYASNQPKQLTRLVLVDASGLPDTLHTHHQLQEKLMSLIPTSLKESVPESLKKSFAKMTNSSVDYRNADEYQRKVLKKIFKEDLTDEAKKIAVPTLIAWGKNDQDTPLHQGQKFHELIKDSQFTVFEQSGHFPFIDESEQFVETILKFLL